MKINESINDDNYTQKVVSVMKPPYIDDLRMFEIPTDKWLDIFSLLFNKDKNSLELDRNINSESTIISINISTNPPKLPLYVEWDSGPWILRDYDEMGNIIYYEESDGYWEKSEYDSNGKPIHFSTSDGYLDNYSENNLNESVGVKENMVIDKIVNFMLEDTQTTLSKQEGEPVIKISYPFYSEQIVIMKWWDLNYYLDNLVDDYTLNDIEVNYISNQYGITDTSIILEIFNRYIKILFTKLKKELESKMEDDSLNESVGDKENMVIDKIVNFMLEDTQYKIKTIKDEPVARIVYPFYGDEIYTEFMVDVDYYLDYLVGDYPLDVIHVDYINNQYGITDTSLILEIFNRYGLILITKLKKELEDKMEDNSLNESVEINDRFIDKVVESLIGDTSIVPKLQMIVYPSINFYSSYISLLSPNKVFYNEFSDYCNKHYGTTDDEFDVVWEKYSKIMFDKFPKRDRLIKESNDRRKNYLDKVLEFILSDTHITSHNWTWVNIEVPFIDLQYSRMRHFDLFNFVNYCRDNYGLTKDESYSVWEDYNNEINQTLINEWGVQDPIYH